MSMHLATAQIDGTPTVLGRRADGMLIDYGRAAGLRSLRDVLNGSWPDDDAFPGAQAIDTEIRYLPLVPDARRILCVGFNYRQHADEAEREVPTKPTFFSRFASAHVGHEQPIVRPLVSRALDWEGEVAVVIGRGGRHISEADAWAAIAGFTCFADNSVRDFQFHGTQATAGKNFERSGSFGPWLVPAADLPDPSALEVITRVNGEQMQHGCLKDLVFGVPELIAYVSSFTTLEPGDVIATGTPAGIGARQQPPRYLVPGDVLEVEIPGVGLLRNHVVDEERL